MRCDRAKQCGTFIDVSYRTSGHLDLMLIRQTSRLLLIDDARRVLLFNYEDADGTWSTHHPGPDSFPTNGPGQSPHSDAAQPDPSTGHPPMRWLGKQTEATIIDRLRQGFEGDLPQQTAPT